MGQNILIQYLTWHFVDTPRVILKAWKNFLRFNFNFWSIPLLLKTLFSHWRRYKYSYGRGLDLKRYFEAFTFNMISRALGAMMRGALIIFGLLIEIFIVFSGAIILLGWLVSPLFLIFGFYYGFKILF